MSIFTKIKAVLNGLFRKEVKDAFDTEILLSDAMDIAINDFYKITSGNPRWVDKDDDIRSINFAGYIDNVTAGLVTLDLDIQIDGGARAELLQKNANYVLMKIYDRVSEGVGNAGIMFKPNQENVDYIEPGNFAPTNADSNGNILGCIFKTSVERGGYIYTRLEWHRFEEDGERKLYHVTNKAYKARSGASIGSSIGKPCTLEEVPEWSGLEEDVHLENVEKPLFAYFKMPTPNKIDRLSALGVPIWVDAIVELEDLDVAWSRKGGETKDSKHVTFIPHQAIRYAAEHDVKLPRFVRGVEIGVGVDGDKSIHEHVSTLLTDSRIKDINSILAMISTKCGFSQGMFQLDEKTGMMTATQVEADDQETIRTIKNIRDALQDTMNQLLYGCNVMADLYSNTPPELWERLEEGITYNFGDITYNYQEDAANWWKYRIQGDVPAWMYYAKFEGMSEDEAKQMIEEAKAEQEIDSNLFDEE